MNNQDEMIETMTRNEAADLVGSEESGSSYTVDPKQSLSVFQENYNYYRSIGHTHLEAKHKAIDYYRRYTRREITSQWEEFHETFKDEKAVSQYDTLVFNETVTLLVNKLDNEKTIKLLFLTIRKAGIDYLLNPANLVLCESYCGDAYPETNYEVARAMGLAVRANGSCTRLLVYQESLVRNCRELNLNFAF